MFRRMESYAACRTKRATKPDILRQIVRDAIEQHIDQGQLAANEAAEQSEREIADLFIDGFNGFQYEAR